MANEVLIKQGSQWLFADVGTDFASTSATAANNLKVGTPTEVQIDLSSLGNGGGARESDKTGVSTPWAARFTMDACVQFSTSNFPSDGGTVDFYWNATPSSAAATANMGGLTGSDAAYTDSAGSLGQLIYVGSMTARATALNIGHVGIFSPPYNWGNLVIVNNTTSDFNSSMDETHVVMTEIIDEIQ